MKTPVYIRHKVGWCSTCGSPVLDAGWTDDPKGWVHTHPIIISSGPHVVFYGVCAMVLSR